ncbi:MAG: response regulator [Bacteroidales bacterium]|nr:response regulator [Bacteroidales bacterium]
MKYKANILLVDDNVNLNRIMSLILGRKGYEVTTAETGFEAIDMVKEKPYDIIFMDIKLPVMDGVETYKKIKKMRSDTVVMMMTAYAVEDLVQEALREGAYGIIYKPMDINKVVGIIEEAKKIKKGALIMVVDDDPGTCTSFRNILNKQGYRVGVANNGDKAIEMAKNKKYDIIFIDMKLPTINGLETYMAIKKVNPEAVAVVMTAYRHEMNELVDEAIRNNVYTCIYKPLDMGETLKMVEDIMKRKGGR